PASTIQAYLFRAVRNRSLNAVVSAKASARVEDMAALETHPIAMSEAPATPDKALDANETQAVVWAAINSLPQETRAVVALRWQAGMSWAEVSEVTGLSVDAARMKHARALKHLKEQLTDFFAS